MEQIKAALGIAGLYTQVTTFHHAGGTQEPGAQIDLLLDRNDGVINLVEVKFYEGTHQVDRAAVARLQRKQEVFKAVTGTRKMLSWVLLTAEGAKPSAANLGVIHHFLSAGELMR